VIFVIIRRFFSQMSPKIVSRKAPNGSSNKEIDCIQCVEILGDDGRESFRVSCDGDLLAFCAVFEDDILPQDEH
jgi:hypothetical protein